MTQVSLLNIDFKAGLKLHIVQELHVNPISFYGHINHKLIHAPFHKFFSPFLQQELVFRLLSVRMEVMLE